MEKGLTSLKDLLIGDRTFEIPVYQRNYSWEEKQCDDLWNDIYYLKPGKKHYFGTILIKKVDRTKDHGLKTFEVFELIDGQQRISTILILLREILNQISSINDPELNEGLQKFQEDYLKYKNIYKLELMGEDREFFKENIIDNQDFPEEILTPSRKRLRDAKSFFKGKFKEIIEEKEFENYKEFLLDFKRKIDDMDIIRYEVENDADAVLIFETVNDRGKLLTNLEKTKSFLMHAIYLAEDENLEGNLNYINETFSNIFRWFEDIKRSDRGKNLREDDIQRYHFIIYEELQKRRETSYKYIEFLKNKIKKLYREEDNKSLEYALDYTNDLKRAFYALKEIINYNDDDEIGIQLDKIFAMDRVANFYPLLIAVWVQYKTGPFTKAELLRILELIELSSFRIYAIGKKRSNSGEGMLYTLGFNIHKNNKNFEYLEQTLITDLIKRYEDDKSFRRDLKLENFYNRVSRNDIKYLLYEYEQSLMREPLEISLKSILVPDFHVEHIWPNNPSKLNLSAKELLIHENNKDKLGNLTIALNKWNERWGNKPFDKKKKDYVESSFKIQNELYKFENWGKSEIDQREQKIINFAFKRWEIPLASIRQSTLE